MNKIYKFSAWRMICIILLGILVLASCDKNDVDTDQYKGGISLNIFGPSPVARGGILRFLGCGLDQVTAVQIPGCNDITDIEVISSEEIRITVPQTAEPGYVTLVFQNGEHITTKTQLTYSEPISIDSFSPESVRPGDLLTINGEYLNLIHQVIFADNVIVSDEIIEQENAEEEYKFLKHTRNEIQLHVPAEARSGKIILSDGAEVPNWIYSELELQVVTPSVSEILHLSGKKPGDKVTVTGENLDLVKEILMPNGGIVPFVYLEDSKSVTFMLPDDVTNGTVYAVTASRVQIAVAEITVAVPEEVIVTPADGIRSGQQLELIGKNMELITSVLFPGASDAILPSSSTPTKVTVVVPEGTVSGNLTLNTGSGAIVNVAIETAKPTNLLCVGEVKAGETATITGDNLDLVSGVIFTDNLEGEIISQSFNQLVVSVPALAQSGNIILKMSNGEQVSDLNLTINTPAGCYIISELEDEYHAGEIMTIEVANGDKLTAIKINGTLVQYILNRNQLMIQIPNTAGENSSLELISGDKTIEYMISFIPAERPETVIWEGSFAITNWNGNQDLGWNGYDWSSVRPGTIITIYYSLNTAVTDWQLRLGGCGIGWAELPTIPATSLAAGSTSFSATLTEEDLEVLSKDNNSGLVVTGCNFTMTKVTLK